MIERVIASIRSSIDRPIRRRNAPQAAGVGFVHGAARQCLTRPRTFCWFAPPKGGRRACAGPIDSELAALGLYELSRRRELGLDLSWTHVFGVRHSLSIGGILALGMLLVVIFLVWVAAAQGIYVANFGYAPPESIPNFLRQVFTTPEGWTLIVVGNGVGFLFAVLVLMICVVSFPLLLDRQVSAAVAVLTSVRVVLRNPVTMTMWGLIVAGLLLIGSLPLFIGLAVVMPVLGHSTWHLYRKEVEPDRARLTSSIGMPSRSRLVAGV